MTQERVVVGTDGSEGSKVALRYAIGEAKRRNATLDVVHAWHIPYGTSELMPIALNLDEIRTGEETSLAALVDSIDHQGVEVSTHLVEGPAATILIEQATGADVLVVGSRGHGGFMGLLLGSVSNQIVNHPPCPVVVVPHPKE